MESNGMPGMVNISAAAYELIKSDYTCEHRGKIYAKNVGEIDMYFVRDEIINSFDTNTNEIIELGQQLPKEFLNTEEVPQLES